MPIAFWLIVVLGALWVAFMPHERIEPPSITVKVQKAPAPVYEVPNAVLDKGDPLSSFFPEMKNIIIPVLPAPPPPSRKPEHKILVALVIDDMGLDIEETKEAIQLPPVVTLSFLPYALRARAQATEARAKGHEILLHMPMEPVGHQSPGPGALLVDLPPSEQEARLDTALASLTGFDGINNHMGSRFTAYRKGMERVANNLLERNLFLLDSRTSAQSVAWAVAQEKGLPSIKRDVFLDDIRTPEALRRQLLALEQIAYKQGYAVAIGHPHAVTLESLKEWIPKAEEKGIKLVPLNVLVREQNAKTLRR
ncbi:MAG: divergent polysaccharide deacetylase family protein [Alphaproteobacteria bacterium]|nr:divergent polysaccharide deacetylase family protein [Alphaproteobacteria bacterium]